MKILIVSATDDAVHIRRLARMVDGYLFKGEAMDHFALAVQGVCRGETYFSPHIVSQMISGMEDKIPPPHLSPREIEVLAWAAQGATSAQIAQKLCISERTVTTHLSRIYKKLAVRGRAAAVAKAIELGYLQTS
jgi:DNA-binding NarL/FixJ family response regulator